MPDLTPNIDAANAGFITLGGDLRVPRLGFGAMRITGDGIWAILRIVRRLFACCRPQSGSVCVSSIPRIPTARKSASG